MKVTLDLPDSVVLVLTRWASVGRTLSNAEWIAEERLQTEDCERSRILLDELQTLKQPLDDLVQLVQNELWRKE